MIRVSIILFSFDLVSEPKLEKVWQFLLGEGFEPMLNIHCSGKIIHQPLKIVLFQTDLNRLPVLGLFFRLVSLLARLCIVNIAEIWVVLANLF